MVLNGIGTSAVCFRIPFFSFGHVPQESNVVHIGKSWGIYGICETANYLNQQTKTKKTLANNISQCTIHLTHWGRVTHLCNSKPTSIASDNGLSPARRQAIIWPNAGILLIGPLGTIFSEILSEIHIFSFKKMLSGKWWPFRLGLNLLKMFVQNHRVLHSQLAILRRKLWFVETSKKNWGTEP